MSIFYLPRSQGFDTNGLLMSGAKLNFYTAGTTTRKSTYSDAGLLTANNNPVVANSAGLFGPIFMAGGSYKIVLTDSADVELWSQDDVSDPSFLVYGGETKAQANTYGLSIPSNANVSPSGDSGVGHFSILGSGYSGYITLDATAMYLGHNSGSRGLRMQTDETDRMRIDGTGLTTFLGPLFQGQTAQVLSGPGAVNLTTQVTYVATTGADALTLANGTQGQMKIVVMTTDGGTGTLTPDNLGNGTTITFDDVGDTANLIFLASNWYWIGGTATLA